MEVKIQDMPDRSVQAGPLALRGFDMPALSNVIRTGR